ncbi:GNAT family N-acetyltransferase [Methanobacterium formicicum]|uniref:N-acetyltransferase GCN5 n=1 Tax=Methanobacterium formicicum (strain DSM 3637 / PP1) TaxID=1204725 RepID=K2QF75_METFP|nr:GNAT family N-acetyltransferase [Methanobacterium formicicum]EKF86746.1 N-acetyltransferase GCN5 [Methanobacterium formicicum DSM 3637]
MSIKTSIREHFTNNHLNLINHFENASFKNHWDYFFQDNPELYSNQNYFEDGSKLKGDLVFRRFNWKDLDECAALFKKVFSADPWFDEWVSLDQSRKYLKELIQNPVFEGFLMCEGSKIVAVCLGHRRSWWMGKEFFVDEFFVENGRQGNGIGTKTVDYLVEILREDGYTRLTLLTNKNIPAETFYLKNGFYNNEKRTVMVKTI